MKNQGKKIWTSFFVTMMAAFLTIPVSFSQITDKFEFARIPLHKILAQEIPLLGMINGREEEPLLPSTKEVALVAFGELTAIRPANPSSILQAGIPILAQVPQEAGEEVEGRPVPQTDFDARDDFKPVIPRGEPLIGIYNTHTGETYELTDGTARLEGKRGGVVAVAKALAQALEEKHGIKVVRSENIHDQIFSQSYTRSEETVQKMLEDYPSLQMIIDVHRDEARERTFVNINGEEVAKVMLVVGTDATLEHPRWKENYAFAREILATMNKMYPGLAKGSGIMVKKGRYNQHLHKHAVLIEIGSNKNSTPEAERSARLVADVIAEVMKKLPKTTGSQAQEEQNTRKEVYQNSEGMSP